MWGSPLLQRQGRMEAPDAGRRHNFMDYVPSTWRRAAPHVWLADGTAVQDRVGYGHGYTLLRSPAPAT